MKLRQIRHALNRSLAKRGLWKTVVFGSRRALGFSNRPKLRMIQHPFDREFGVRTSGVIFRREGDERHNYHGVTPSVFREACKKWCSLIPDSVEGIEEFSFIDLGCGMGRAVLMASELPFREVVGIEFDDKLTEIAQTNIAKWVTAGRARSPIAIHRQDVLDYKFPQPPLLVFLYNPFGESILEPTLFRLQQLQRNSSTPVDILYVHPKYSYLFDILSGFRLLWSERISFDDADRLADDFGSRSEVCSIYRLCS